jgi:hypothetical protein
MDGSIGMKRGLVNGYYPCGKMAAMGNKKSLSVEFYFF